MRQVWMGIENSSREGMPVTSSAQRSRRRYSDTGRRMIDVAGRILEIDDYGNVVDPSVRFAPAEPPLPVGPSEEERRSHLSDTHRRTLVRDGILVADIEQAIAVIETYGGRRTMPITGDAAARHPDSSSGMGVAMVALGEAVLGRGSDAFLDRVVANIRSEFATKGRYYDGWDYDGPGAFHKTTIRIEPAGSGLVVRISAVRSDPEPRLAKSLGLRHRLLRGEHHVTWATQGDDYRIPLRQLIQAARIAGATEPRSAEAVFRELVSPTGDSDFGPAVLHEDERIRVTASIDEVRVPAGWKLKQMARDARLDTVPAEWNARFVEDDDGPAMVGRAHVGHQWPDPWASGIRISVSPVDPMDTGHEDAAITSSNDIARLWAGLPGSYGENRS